MRSLLKKDIYMIWKVAPLIPFIMVFISVISLGSQSNWGLLVEMGILSVTLVMLCMEVDEGNRWHVFQDTMPISRRMVVCEKYILLCLGALVSTALQAFCNTVYGLIKWGRVEAGNILFLPMIIFASAVIFGAVQLPFYFRFGCIRGRTIHRIMLAFGMITAVTLAREFKIPQHIPLHPMVLFSGLLGIGLAVAVVSYLISVRMYRKRDLR